MTRYSTDVVFINIIQAYIQSIMLKNTLESIFFNYHRGVKSDGSGNEKPELPKALELESGLASAITM